MTQTPNTPQPAAESAPALVQTATVLETGTPATSEAAETTEVTETAATASDTQGPTAVAGNERQVHFYILLDRSGSMESMKSDVIGGFNSFLAEQQAVKGRARLTLVQFDSQNPQETIVDAGRLKDVTPLTAATFSPRGGTPLLDATAELIERVLGRQAKRAALGSSEEEVVFITITDGEENQSVRAGLADVKRLIDVGTEHGWSFVFLGAGVDAYADAGRLGYSVDSVQAWDADGEGAQAMWGSVSRAAHTLRVDVAMNATFDKKAYFRGVKEAEARRLNPS
jgi:Mg-chelatase subunit ChlD